MVYNWSQDKPGPVRQDPTAELTEIRKLCQLERDRWRNVDFEQRVMAIIRCTAKLLKELADKLTNVPDQPPSLCDWHANLLRLDRKKYVLFTNDQTLYSLLVRQTKTPRSADFLEVFRLGLFKSLMNEGLAEAQVEYVLREHAQATITKTNSRSVLGSMNDLAFQAKSIIHMSGGLAEADLSEITRQLNRIPMSAIKYRFSIDELKRRLADECK